MSFNPTLVRLRLLPVLFLPLVLFLFQSHIGSITTISVNFFSEIL